MKAGGMPAFVKHGNDWEAGLHHFPIMLDAY
jgi:hypothetical protein